MVNHDAPVKVMQVVDEGGNKILIKANRFNPEIHSLPGEKKKKKEPVKEEPANDRFAELKAKGWKNLSGEERKEYSLLKNNQ